MLSVELAFVATGPKGLVGVVAGAGSASELANDGVAARMVVLISVPAMPGTRGVLSLVMRHLLRVA
jgi:hypothetical protein